MGVFASIVGVRVAGKGDTRMLFVHPLCAFMCVCDRFHGARVARVPMPGHVIVALYIMESKSSHWPWYQREQSTLSHTHISFVTHMHNPLCSIRCSGQAIPAVHRFLHLLIGGGREQTGAFGKVSKYSARVHHNRELFLILHVRMKSDSRLLCMFGY